MSHCLHFESMSRIENKLAMSICSGGERDYSSSSLIGKVWDKGTYQAFQHGNGSHSPFTVLEL